MKKLFTLAVTSLMFLGAVAAQETDKNNEICGDKVCETAEELGLYLDIGEIDSSIDEVRSVLDRCGTEYCRAVAESADGRKGLIQDADESSRSGEIEETSETLKEIEEIVRGDIEDSEAELDNGRTEPEIVDNVLSIENRILALTQSAITSSEEASKAGSCQERCSSADRCPERCLDQTDNQDTEEISGEMDWPPKNSSIVFRSSDGSEVGQVVLRGDRVSLVGFGSFSVSKISSDDQPEVSEQKMIPGTSSFYQTVPEDGEISCSTVEDAVVCRTSGAGGSGGSVYCWGNNEHCRADTAEDSNNDEARLHCSGDRCPAEAVECPVCGELEREAESDAFKCGDGVCVTRNVGGEEVEWQLTTEGDINVLAAAQSGSETRLVLGNELDKSSPLLMMSIYLDEDDDGDGVPDADTDGDGLLDLAEGEFPKEWLLPSMDLRAELSSGDGKIYAWGDNRVRTALENDGEVYCWGSNRCVIREEVERTDSDFRCELKDATMGNRIGDDCDDTEPVWPPPTTEPDSPKEDEDEAETPIRDGVNPVNDPPTASDEEAENSIRNRIGRFTRSFGNIFR